MKFLQTKDIELRWLIICKVNKLIAYYPVPKFREPEHITKILYVFLQIERQEVDEIYERYEADPMLMEIWSRLLLPPHNTFNCCQFKFCCHNMTCSRSLARILLSFLEIRASTDKWWLPNASYWPRRSLVLLLASPSELHTWLWASVIPVLPRSWNLVTYIKYLSGTSSDAMPHDDGINKAR